MASEGQEQAERRLWNVVELYGHETIVLFYTFNAIWYEVAGNAPLSIVLVRDPAGKYPDTAFFDTDMGASDIVTNRRYTCPWGTEITNRETKGLLGSVDPRSRIEKSVTRTPLMAYWSYSLLMVWFVSQFRMGKDLLPPRVSRDHGKQQNFTKTIPARYTGEQGFPKMAKLWESAFRRFLASVPCDDCQWLIVIGVPPKFSLRQDRLGVVSHNVMVKIGETEDLLSRIQRVKSWYLELGPMTNMCSDQDQRCQILHLSIIV